MRISFSAPPRKSTPCGITVATIPPGLQTASMCRANIRSAFFPGGRTPSPAIPLGKFHVAFRVVLAEWRIGDHPVETLEFPAFPVQGMQQGILEPNIGAPNAVQEHVDFADGPGRGIVYLAAEAKIGRIAAGLLDILAADDQHAAGTASGIVDTHSRSGIQHADHRTDHIPGRIKVPALLAGRFREHVDEEFAGGPEQVGKPEVLVAKAVAIEMAHQFLARLVRNNAFVALDLHEPNVIQNIPQRLVGFAYGRQRLVQNSPVRPRGVV